jgi:hypothetical protein
MADLRRYNDMQFIDLMAASGVKLTVINGQLIADEADELLPEDERIQLLERSERLIPAVIRREQDWHDKRVQENEVVVLFEGDD